MAQIVIDTDNIWKSIKTPLAVAGILVLILLAAFAGYNAGKNNHVNATFNITPIPGFFVQNFTVDGTSLAPDSSYTFFDQTSNHTINVTLKKRICSRLTFTDENFMSPSVRYFDDSNLFPAGIYTLDVKGWYSPWSEDKGWFEEGAAEKIYKTAAWGALTNLKVGETTQPLLKIVKGSFDHENSKGSASITLSSPSRVGIQINDSTYIDNRGSAIFVFRDTYDSTCTSF